MADVKSGSQVDTCSISWEQFTKDVKKLAYKITQNEIRMRERYSGIYGIPRNGTLIAVMLSHLTGLPLLLKPIRSCIIIDDVAETGQTLKNAAWSVYSTAVLYRKDSTKYEPDFYVSTINGWIQLPFETKESSKVDYREKR